MKTLATLIVTLASSLALLSCGGSGGDVTTVATQGLWIGTTTANRATTGLVFSDGTFYVFYSAVGDALSLAGVVQGSGSATGNIFLSSNAKDFNLEGEGISPATVSGNFIAKQSFNGTVAYTSFGASTFSSNYDASYEATPSLAGLAGTFTGEVALSDSIQSAVVTVSPSGALSSTVDGCLMSGTATPRTDGNAFNLSITFGASPCLLANQTLAGVAYFNSTTKRLYAAAPNASRTDGLLFVGTKP